MNDSVPQPPIPGMPPPPPELNRRRLWLSLLIPPGVMILVTAFVAYAVSANINFGDEVIFTAICAVICLATAAGWALFIHTMCRRFRGGSLALLIIFYPIVQAILHFSVFFVGCLAVIWSSGY